MSRPSIWPSFQCPAGLHFQSHMIIVTFARETSVVVTWWVEVVRSLALIIWALVFFRRKIMYFYLGSIPYACFILVWKLLWLRICTSSITTTPGSRVSVCAFSIQKIAFFQTRCFRWRQTVAHFQKKVWGQQNDSLDHSRSSAATGGISWHVNLVTFNHKSGIFNIFWVALKPTVDLRTRKDLKKTCAFFFSLFLNRALKSSFSIPRLEITVFRVFTELSVCLVLISVAVSLSRSNGLGHVINVETHLICFFGFFSSVWTCRRNE